MKIADFIRINDSARTVYYVYRGDNMVDFIEKDYLTQDSKHIQENTRRINRLLDTNGYVERFAPYYEESASRIWLHVYVQIGTRDYPDRW